MMNLSFFNVNFSTAEIYLNQLPIIQGAAAMDDTGTTLVVQAVYPLSPAVFALNATSAGRVTTLDENPVNATLVEWIVEGEAPYTGCIGTKDGQAVRLVFNASQPGGLSGSKSAAVVLVNNITFTMTNDTVSLLTATPSVSQSLTPLVVTLPPQPGVALVDQTITKVAAPLTVLAAAGGMATQAGRTMALLRMVECGSAGADGDPLATASLAESPLQLTLAAAGSSARAQLQGGVVVGDVVLMLGIALAVLLLAGAREASRSKANALAPRQRAMRMMAAVRFPGLMVIPFELLVQAVVRGSVGLLVIAGASAVGRVCGVIGVLLVAAMMVGGVVGTRWLFAVGGVRSIPATGEHKLPFVALQAAVGRREEWVSGVADGAGGRRALWMALLVIDPYLGRAPWFLLVDLAVSILTGIADVLSSVFPCLIGQVLYVVLFLLYLVALVAVRPFATALNMACQVTVAVGQLVAAILGVTGVSSAAATYLLLYCSLAVTLAAGVEIVLLAVDVLREWRWRRSEEGRRARAVHTTFDQRFAGASGLTELVAQPAAPAGDDDALMELLVPRPPRTEAAATPIRTPRAVDTAADGPGHIDVDIAALLGLSRDDPGRIHDERYEE